jgi:hypothetical protein
MFLAILKIISCVITAGGYVKIYLKNIFDIAIKLVYISKSFQLTKALHELK